jgi:hypothetical protein
MLQAVVLPSEVEGLRAPGLRFGDPRVMALFAAMASLSHVVGGLTNAGLCRLMVALWEPTYGPSRATYDLRRLRREGFIERVEGTNTYRLTAHGRTIACFFTKVWRRGSSCPPSPNSKPLPVRTRPCLDLSSPHGGTTNGKSNPSSLPQGLRPEKLDSLVTKTPPKRS